MSLDASGFAVVTLVWAALAVPVGIYSLVGTDHVGRTGGNPRGPRVAARWGWFGMELPALGVLPAVYLAAANRHPVGDLLVAAWVVHYAHRTLVWPWIVQRRSRPMPVVTCVSAVVFNVINGLLIGWFLGRLADYPPGWLRGPPVPGRRRRVPGGRGPQRDLRLPRGAAARPAAGPATSSPTAAPSGFSRRRT